MNKAFIIIPLLLMAAMILMATSPDYGSDLETGIRTYRGQYLVENGIPYVLENGVMHRLLLAPQEALDSLGIHLEEKDSLYVEGAPLKQGVLVTRLTPDAKQGQDWNLRNNDLSDNYYDEVTTTKVIPAKCIGCKLCVPNCPVSAIAMERGKAVIDTVRCVECGICIDGNGKWKGCPVGAISK